VAALFELVSDPTPNPAAAKRTVDKDEGLTCRLGAGGPEHVAAGRCRHETDSGCSTAKRAAASNLNFSHGARPGEGCLQVPGILSRSARFLAAVMSADR
jgi:hypothetical protein